MFVFLKKVLCRKTLKYPYKEISLNHKIFMYILVQSKMMFFMAPCYCYYPRREFCALTLIYGIYIMYLGHLFCDKTVLLQLDTNM